MKTALFQSVLEGEKLRCGLCPHHCVLAEGGIGLCRVRGVKNGELKALFYGVLSAANLDPVEKKPLYHFCPGMPVFSIGGWGCNLACDFCQNWSISQDARFDARTYEPRRIVEEASKDGSIGIAYTYNEPVVGYEFMKDCATAARKAGIANVMVTNGFIESGPASEILPLIDALNIDIKSMDEDFYRLRCRGRLAPVLKFAQQAIAARCHVEITNLVIPGANDGGDSFERLSAWIADNLGDRTPLHLSAYHPDFKADDPATSSALLEKAMGICRKKLLYVYLGNVRTSEGRNTICRQCGKLLIERQGYAVSLAGIRDGKCAGCGSATDIKGV